MTDLIAPEAEKAIDRSSVFSYRLLSDDPEGYMFAPSGECFSSFSHALLSHLGKPAVSYVVVADVASFFERLNLHVLPNLLESAGCVSGAVRFLNKLLLSFSQQNSYGIAQGLFPSDFLGNFYLCSIDERHKATGVASIRYVDDIYGFFESSRDARLHLVRLASWLRTDGLGLNEAKSSVRRSDEVRYEETEIDSLLTEATAEVESELERADFYGSTVSWDQLDERESPEVEVKLEATHRLFDFDTESPGLRRKIDSFCLAAFTASFDTYAVEYVVKRFLGRPHMAQPFTKYLKAVSRSDETILPRMAELLSSGDLLFDFQRLWLYALLDLEKSPTAGVLDSAVRDLQDEGRDPTVRAACAVMIGKHGGPAQRRILRTRYENEQSPYVRAAILYAVRDFPKSERDACFRAWEGHDEIHPLIIAAARKLRAMSG